MTSFIPTVLEGASIPHRVFDLPEPPKQLFLIGELPRGPSVAVIGTRHPTMAALAYTEALVAELGAGGCHIWSGGAEGIDSAAHRAALLCGARTVVVAPAGWERPYPAENAELFLDIVAQCGAYVSLVPADRQALPHLFFARNALLTAMVDAVVIVQAGFRSGARNAAKFARALGRPLFAVPSCPWVGQGIGCNLELQLGARILLSSKDVIAAASGCAMFAGTDAHCERVSSRKGVELHITGSDASMPVDAAQHAKRTPRGRNSTTSELALGDELQQLLDHLRSGARNVDDLCQRTGRPAAVIQSDVLRLTLFGLATTDTSGTITLITT